MQTGFQNTATPSLLSIAESSMLAVIKVYFDGLQMVKIAQIPIVVHGGTCTQPRRNFLFSISSFLDNVKIKIWYGVV